MTNHPETISQKQDEIRTSCSFDLSFGESILRGIIGDYFIENSRVFHFCPHNHAFYELQLVLNGPVFVRIRDKEYMAQQGSLCIIHPYEYHTYLRPKDPSHQYRLATFSFYIKDLCSGSYQGLNLAAAISALNGTYNIPDMHGQLLPLLAQISMEFQNKAPGYLIAVAELLKLLLVRVFRAVSPHTALPEKSEQALSREIIIDRFYLNHYRECVTMGQLSQQLHVSDRRTNQLIHQLYGRSFSEKLTDIRLEIAKLFLSYSDYSVAQIAEASGFPSVNFFYKTFRKHNGISPGQYRERQAGLFRDSVEYIIQD